MPGRVRGIGRQSREDGEKGPVVVGSVSMTTSIHNGWVLTMDPAGTVHSPGYVLFEADRITAVGPGESPPADQMIDARGGIIMPGMINSHTHIAMALFRSMADDRSDRLRKVLFPLESRAVTPELVYQASIHALLELIRGGVTTIADMYYFEMEAARATAEAGLRAVLGETVVDFTAPDAAEPYGGLAYTRDFLAEWRGHPLITPAVAPHAPYTVDDDHLVACFELSAEKGIPIMMHLAEMPFEVEGIRSAYGVSPVERMEQIGVLGPALTAAHCVFTDETDHELLQRRDVGVAHNLVANLKGGKGVAPLKEMQQRGVRVGLGTDGPMSGNRLDLLAQMREVAHVHKGVHGDPTLLPAREVAHLATIGGARALHMEEHIGSLEVGKQADIAVISVSDPALTPVHDPWSVIVYGATPNNVSTTVVAGRVLMRDRVIAHLDIDAIVARSTEIGADLGRFLAGL